MVNSEKAEGSGHLGKRGRREGEVEEREREKGTKGDRTLRYD